MQEPYYLVTICGSILCSVNSEDISKRISGKKHTKIYVYTEKKTMELETFSIFVCNKNDGIFWDDTTLGSAEYQDLLKTLDKRNQYSNIEKKNIEEYYNNQMFSLISCRGAAGTPTD